MASQPPVLAALSKVAVFALLYFICFKRACLPRDEHLSYSAGEAVDPAEHIVLRGVDFSRQWIDAIGAMALLLYLLQPLRHVCRSEAHCCGGGCTANQVWATVGRVCCC